MCTRYYIEPEIRIFRDLIDEVRRSGLADRFAEAGRSLVTSGEVRPTDVVPVIAPDRKGGMSVFPMKWGFSSTGGSLLINARTETAQTKPSFRESWKKRRCIIPASWYYEWEHFSEVSGRKKTGDKYAIRPKDQPVTWLAGLYRVENSLPAFTVLTREPSAEIGRLHDRMPLIFPEELIAGWTDPASDPEELIRYSITELTAERAGDGPGQIRC